MFLFLHIYKKRSLSTKKIHGMPHICSLFIKCWFLNQYVLNRELEEAAFSRTRTSDNREWTGSGTAFLILNCDLKWQYDQKK